MSARRKLLFLTQQVDPAHPSLAATVPKLRALAARVDELVVVAQSAVSVALPGNTRVRVFGAPSRAARVTRFLRLVAEEVRGASAVVAHMIPLYVVLAAPLARPRRVPVALWFVQAKPTAALRAAERLANVVLSVDAGSFPLASRKLHAIGHGIDVDEFTCVSTQERDEVRVLGLGRYSRSKGWETVVRGVRLARERGLDVRLDVYGPTLTDDERRHRAELERLAGDGVALHDAVPRERVPALLGAADVLVNNMVETAADKVVYEACASCVPALASSPVFARLLPPELRFERESPGSLADRLVLINTWGIEERSRVGRELRERVAREHSVESWADGVLRAVGV